MKFIPLLMLLGCSDNTYINQWDVMAKEKEDPAVMMTLSIKEYEKLIEDQTWLRALEAAGVDNWQGYDEAIDILNDWEK